MDQQPFLGCSEITSSEKTLNTLKAQATIGAYTESPSVFFLTLNKVAITLFGALLQLKVLLPPLLLLLLHPSMFQLPTLHVNGMTVAIVRKQSLGLNSSSEYETVLHLQTYKLKRRTMFV